MSREYIFDFVDQNSRNHILTIYGKQAKDILNHSPLLQHVFENSPTERKLTIPISFPYGRIDVFKKLMKGDTVGQYVLKPNPSGGKLNPYIRFVEFDPLSPEEEEVIDNLSNDNELYQEPTRVESLPGPLLGKFHVERARAIRDILRFFLFDPHYAATFVKIRPLSDNNTEKQRRLNIVRNRHVKNKQNFYNRHPFWNPNENLDNGILESTVPFLDEDTIEDLIEKHKNYLFGMYHPPGIMFITC